MRVRPAAAGAILLVLGVAAAGPAVAQPAAPLSIDLDTAIARALAASNRVVEAAARADAAAAIVGERHAQVLPQVAALAGYTRTNHVDQFGILLPNNQLKIIYPDIPDNYRTRLDVQWPVYTAGRQEAIETGVRRESAAATLDVESARADLRLDVTRAFWNLVVARESLRVLTESVARMGGHVRDVQNQLDAGLVPPNDLLTIQAQQAHQRMLAIQAAASGDVAEADLARLIGAPPGTSIVPSAPLEAPQVTGSVESLVAEAREQRADRRALVERVAAAQTRIAVAAAGRRPMVAVAGGVDYSRPNPRIFPRVGQWEESWDAGVNVSWPLFDGGRSRHETAEASAGVRASQARLAEFDSLLAVDVRQRLAEIASSRAALDAADVAVRAATEARRVVGDRFAAGVATSTDVLDAQVAVLQAELDRTQAIAAGRLAEARLHRAVGR